MNATDSHGGCSLNVWEDKVHRVNGLVECIGATKSQCADKLSMKC